VSGGVVEPVEWDARAQDDALALNRLHVRVRAVSEAEQVEAWLVTVPVGVCAWLREVFAKPDPDRVARAAVVLELDGGVPVAPVAAAGIAACRGLVLSLAEEVARHGRLNLVVSYGAAANEVDDTVAYLAAPTAAFTTAATLTLGVAA
jgi:hypothetical protein